MYFKYLKKKCIECSSNLDHGKKGHSLSATLYTQHYTHYTTHT